MNKSTKKTAVIYKSYYGTTKQYAEWIAEALNASLFEASDIKPAQLMDYDVVVYGGGLYAGGVIGSELVAQNPSKSLVVFTVGAANANDTDFSNILAKNFGKDYSDKLKVFHLRGGIDYGKLSLAHKTMMWMVKKDAEKKPEAERSADDRLLLETYGDKVDFMDKESIAPLLEFITSLC